MNRIVADYPTLESCSDANSDFATSPLNDIVAKVLVNKDIATKFKIYNYRAEKMAFARVENYHFHTHCLNIAEYMRDKLLYYV